jgi:DNA polymerase/3'-5' exonuclease PolX
MYLDFGGIILHEISKTEHKIPLKHGCDIAEGIIEQLKLKFINPYTIKPDLKGQLNWGIPVGSIRRKVSEISDIDILITDKLYYLEKVSELDKFLNWIEKGEDKIGFMFHCNKYNVDRKVELYLCKDMKSFGSMLLHTTGPDMYNIYLRKLAKDQGLLLNQYGVFKNGKQIAGDTEESCYKVLKSKNFPKGKEWKEPWLRGLE